MKTGYARVSTKEQTVDLQVDALKKAGCTKVYTEIMSGTRAERPILGNLLENLRAGDVLVVWKLDRLGRSLKHLIAGVPIIRPAVSLCRLLWRSKNQSA
jgi:DNA invertase Pin-like site-specific DNA recombinase